MSYNIHPIFVHFPIALLLLYSVIKILPLKRWFPNVSWNDIERLLLLTGTLGAFAALATGDSAEHLVHPNKQLVEAHSTFGGIATFLYVALLIGEQAKFVNSKNYSFINNHKLLRRIYSILEKLLANQSLSKLIAFVALIAIAVTGLLGGVIAYGLTADPFAPLVLKILGINL